MGKTYRFDTNTLPIPPQSLTEFLDTMKNNCPINEYTDPSYSTLKTLIASYEQVQPGQITVTNSGDEAIDILAKAFLNPGDLFITTPPTYEMFTIQCSINRGVPYDIPLSANKFELDKNTIIRISNKPNVKLLFLVNPNNPTGSVIEPSILENIIQKAGCMVVVDEVYREFYGKSVVSLIQKYTNLVILRSLSKFAGIAGARVGYLLANEVYTKIFNAIRLPMGVSYLSSQLACFVLKNDTSWMQKQIQVIIRERSRITKALSSLGLTVYPSQANFLLVNTGKHVPALSAKLKKQNIIVRNLDAKRYLNGCIRITIRNPMENDILIQACKGIV